MAGQSSIFLIRSRTFTLGTICLWISLVQSFCFTPDRSLSSDLPCDTAAGNSTCCELGFSCTTNNLCLDPQNLGGDGTSTNGMYVRGTCTDENWQSGACQQKCITNDPGTGERVVHCGEGKYCCDGDAPNCCRDTSIEKFDLKDPTIYTVIGAAAAQVPASKSTTSPAPSSNPTSTSTTPTETGVAANANTTLTTQPTRNATQEQTGTDNNNKILVVGLGVGLPLGFLLVASIAGAIWWFTRMERKSIEREQRLKEEVIKVVELQAESRSIYEMMETEKNMRQLQHEMPC